MFHLLETVSTTRVEGSIAESKLFIHEWNCRFKNPNIPRTGLGSAAHGWAARRSGTWSRYLFKSTSKRNPIEKSKKENAFVIREFKSSYSLAQLFVNEQFVDNVLFLWFSCLDKPVDSKTQTYHGRDGAGRRTAGWWGGAGQGRTGSRWVGSPKRQPSFLRCRASKKLSWSGRTKPAVDHRLTTGPVSCLSAGRRPPFISDCWPVYRRLFVFLNSCHVCHVREPFACMSCPENICSFSNLLCIKSDYRDK